MFAWIKEIFMSDPLFPRKEWYLINNNTIVDRRWTERPSGPILNNVQAAHGYEWQEASKFRKGKR